ncbi:isopenicillin N synthase family dioxygenase [Ilumatobacter nonamiensis]|uniref:isopenicillin N synthase family dioxygenase n=1 Tax=Ilumatobacter nonamiensis TaxID=467093 RepID=UPI0003488DC6|nr:2-oxoglutarate and iron-dependent oxygenase domain-containing protein [Ilumatobacter nonamiensis]
MAAASAAGFDEIPIVSLGAIAGPPDPRQELADTVRRICHEIGFMVVTDHGVDDAVVADVFDLMRRFFALDESERALIDKRRSPHFRGWEAVGSEFTNNRVDVREQIDVWSEWPTATTTNGPVHDRLHGPNQWMPTEVLTGQREITERWMDELGSLADRILSLLAAGLGLDDDFFVDLFGDRPMSLTKMINYPPTPTGGAGVNAHHDTGFLTLLAPGTVAGLEVLNPAGEWIAVPAVPGSFVVNLGEMLQSMTGNYFVATAHRVITTEPRMSAAYFHGPSLDTPLEPIDLDRRFVDAVAASPRHFSAGFMASAAETESGVSEMASRHRADTYGQQLWNYFVRSYPDNVARHHPDA